MELKPEDFDLLINLVGEEIHRVGKREAPDHFYRLVDIRNKLLAMSLELRGFSALGRLFAGKGKSKEDGDR